MDVAREPHVAREPAYAAGRTEYAYRRGLFLRREPADDDGDGVYVEHARSDAHDHLGDEEELVPVAEVEEGAADAG
jgi:hypothetical protein